MRALSTLVLMWVLSLGVSGQQADLSKLRPTRDDPASVMRFQSANLRDVLTSIAESHGMRVEFSPEVNAEKKIGNFALTHATAVKAIEIVLRMADVSAVVVDETTLRIVPKE
jgi:type II secretory pathway component GspD/PulD (secretin)